MKTHYCVYILCSRRNSTLYVGMTSNLIKRVYEHENGIVDGFAKKHGVHYIVWYETHETLDVAILREKLRKNLELRRLLSKIEDRLSIVKIRPH